MKRTAKKSSSDNDSGEKCNLSVNREVRDRLFRFLFSQDREALLQLYNALNGTRYDDAAALEIVTVEDVVYLSMKNDLAFIISGTMNMYEHQSTYNPNMPLRFFLYLGQEYRKILAACGKQLYGTVLIPLPTPQCVVFYNGERDTPDEKVLKLSDAFERKDRHSGVELEVRLLNINLGHNSRIMEQCRKLKEYSYFVDRIKGKLRSGLPVGEAVNEAVAECLEKNVLADFLKQHRMEVMEMLLTEYNEKETMEYLRREALDIGRAEGKAEAVLQLLEELGECPETLINRVMGETDPITLKGWLRQAAKADCVEDFESFLSESKKSGK